MAKTPQKNLLMHPDFQKTYLPRSLSSTIPSRSLRTVGSCDTLPGHLLVKRRQCVPMHEPLREDRSIQLGPVCALERRLHGA